MLPEDNLLYGIAVRHKPTSSLVTKPWALGTMLAHRAIVTTAGSTSDGPGIVRHSFCDMMRLWLLISSPTVAPKVRATHQKSLELFPFKIRAGIKPLYKD